MSMANEQATAQVTPKGAPLHNQMTEEERIIWTARNRGVFRDISEKIPGPSGRSVSAAHVSAIFNGAPISTPLAKTISKAIDREIRKSRRHSDSSAA